MRRAILLVTLVAAILLACAGVVLAQQTTPASSQPKGAAGSTKAAHVDGEILVKFKDRVSNRMRADTHQAKGGKVKSTIPRIDVDVVQVTKGDEQSKVDEYKSDPNVKFAELNVIYNAFEDLKAQFSPNDPRYSQQYQYPRIVDDQAWDTTQGDPNIKVAVLDTGLNMNHEDLASKIVAQQDFTGYGVEDYFGHGTHVAGSVGATTNNGIGVAGTCPNCSLMNGKVLDDYGSGSSEGVASGIIWAADSGANVVSMSLGCQYPDYPQACYSQTLDDAVQYAWGNNVVVVAAAGNNDLDNDTYPTYPANYPNVISVAATDSNDNKAYFSNYGKTTVSVAAPGVDILSTAPNHDTYISYYCDYYGACPFIDYGTISGTSMATPHIGGLAGLIWSKSGLCTTNTCVRQQIEDKADQIAGTGTYWANGRINAYGSVNNTALKANNDSYSTNQDTTLDVPSPGVLTNDTGGSQLTAVKASDPSNGTLTLNSDGSFTYMPNQGFNGTDSFTYKADDGQAQSNAATVTITVKAANHPPAAADDSYSTKQGQSLNQSAPGVLANDTDADGDTLMAVKASDPSNGTLTLNSDGSFTYTPSSGFSGSDSFTYKANDGTADSNTATVNIKIAADVTPPTVSSVSPANNERSVWRYTNVKATFTEAIDPKTLVTTPTDPANPNVGTSTTFTLIKSGSATPISAEVTLSSDGLIATLDPYGPTSTNRLSRCTWYKATVKGGASGVKDKAGTPLAANKVWSFKTRC